MKLFLSTLLIFSFISCNSPNKTTPKIITPEEISPIIENEVVEKPVQQELLLQFSQKVLSSIKENKWSDFSSFIESSQGVRFSPYAYADTLNDIVLTKSDFSPISKKKILWGSYDGSGEPISLTVNEYFKTFVYDVDFIHAEQIKQDTMIGFGNSFNNFKEAYPNAHFIEYHFSGFDPEYDGMDWKSLRLVFEEKNGTYFLIGIIHDQWTI